MRIMKKHSLPPSPGAREHISIDLVNTLTTDRNGTQDTLDSPDATIAWLIHRGLLPVDSDMKFDVHARVVRLREQIRSVFSAYVDGEAVDAKALEGLNAALAAAPQTTTLRFTPGSGFYRDSDPPTTNLIEHALSIIADDVASLLTGDTAPMLARCEATPCTRFLLRTHGRRQWCSTRCGDRVRAARAYARKRERQKA